jgi:hypothetical protein
MGLKVSLLAQYAYLDSDVITGKIYVFSELNLHIFFILSVSPSSPT